jgi:hypothetical protein
MKKPVAVAVVAVAAVAAAIGALKQPETCVVRPYGTPREICRWYPGGFSPDAGAGYDAPFNTPFRAGEGHGGCMPVACK